MPPGIQTYAPGPGPHTIGCAVCGNHKSPTDTPLRKCSRCMNIFYCSRACQRIDWPAHKHYCSRPRPLGMQEQNDFENMLRAAFGGPDGTGMQLGNGMAVHIGPRSGDGLEEDDDDETGGDGGWMIHTRPASVDPGNAASGSPSAKAASRPSPAPQTTTPTNSSAKPSAASASEYHRLLDTFFIHIILKESFHPDQILTDGFPMSRFKHFLDLAEVREGILPSSWNSEVRNECEEFVEHLSGSKVKVGDSLEGLGMDGHGHGHMDGGRMRELMDLAGRIYGSGV